MEKKWSKWFMVQDYFDMKSTSNDSALRSQFAFMRRSKFASMQIQVSSNGLKCANADSSTQPTQSTISTKPALQFCFRQQYGVKHTMNETRSEVGDDGESEGYIDEEVERWPSFRGDYRWYL
ncbi:hypothetical protein PAAG_11691 [Paracoccidioides lutzii Pb01]|uniref:Uncharacterized protein n=1 Tax=Paracoccidioides lutzii (strain ATCC MYA-826 / Pb01) TaxID=502779 RepID=A0A0A2V632_PARBA|nr:hypothetical protein PAAG_11691 [Paracoccidioides lutzii Pb01]KGQ01565.1 hypothetical protein PAAG_11691 [Paracoccidioides lutzii Pb01]